MRRVKRISILGCGWLGFPLALRLTREGYPVKGSTTRVEERNRLLHYGIPLTLLTVEENGIEGEASDFFKTDCLIITLPFKRSFSDPVVYFRHMQSVLTAVKQFSVPWVILMSSTLVYPSHSLLAVETIDLTPDSLRGKIQLDVEKLWLDSPDCDATILRLAGLFGPDRLPGRFLRDKAVEDDGSAPVNLVHREDVIEIIVHILQRKCQNEIFNICADTHPTKKEFYTYSAQKQGFPLPVFSSEPSSKYKIVDNTKIKTLLGYTFRYGNLMKLFSFY